jgi:dTDP-4-dehydrorhamnose reductase
MTICILGAGAIGTSISKSLSPKSSGVHLCSSKDLIEDEAFGSKIFSHKYGQITKIASTREIKKCILTTRIDLLSKENENLIFEDIKSLASMGCEFINLSSVSVYGSSLFPKNESAQLNPVNKYGEMKIKIETLLNEIIPEEKLTHLRIANLYGNVGFNDLTNKTLLHLLKDRELTISSNYCLRDFISYKDLEVFVEDWISDRVNSQGIINFASGTSISIEDWIGMIGKITNRNIKYRKGFAEQLQYSVIDHQKLQNAWNRTLTDSKVGLAEYIYASYSNQ